jgi:hypothetical protein
VTLITGVLTDEYVALMSDRRVTVEIGTRIVSQEDTDTKTIALGGQFLMGFTGLARIGKLRIEVWVGRVLKGVKLEDYFEVLRRETEAAFVRERQAGRMPHVFLAVGYASLRPAGPVHPLCLTISNSLDRRGRFSTAVPVSSQFGISVERLANRRQLIVPAGCRVHETTLRALEHRIRVVVRGDPSNPALTVWPLLTALHDTAKRSCGYVGRDVLFASMPRRALPDYSIRWGRDVDYRTQVASVFLPDGARNAGDAIMHMAALINPRMHIMGIEVFNPKPATSLAGLEGYGP